MLIRSGISIGQNELITWIVEAWFPVLKVAVADHQSKSGTRLIVLTIFSSTLAFHTPLSLRLSTRFYLCIYFEWGHCYGREEKKAIRRKRTTAKSVNTTRARISGHVRELFLSNHVCLLMFSSRKISPAHDRSWWLVDLFCMIISFYFAAFINIK